jgi:shikimate 5-dehydrogenase
MVWPSCDEREEIVVMGAGGAVVAVVSMKV